MGRRAGFTCSKLCQPRLCVTAMPYPTSGQGPQSCWFLLAAWRVRGMNTGFWCVAVRAMVSSSSKPPATCCVPVCLWERVAGLLWDECHLGSMLLMGRTKGP